MGIMKALVKKKAAEGLWLEEVPIPQMDINDVLIEVLRTGICGTDLHIYNWDAWAQKTVPVLLVVGHEFVGRIFNMLTIQGIYGREMYETWYKMTVMIQSGLDITPVITHRFPYTEFEQGFTVMRTGESGKVVLTWKEG
jgi:threonine dehydrogenase-like Zn-dependent dehydrogenase